MSGQPQHGIVHPPHEIEVAQQHPPEAERIWNRRAVKNGAILLIITVVASLIVSAVHQPAAPAPSSVPRVLSSRAHQNFSSLDEPSLHLSSSQTQSLLLYGNRVFRIDERQDGALSLFSESQSYVAGTCGLTFLNEEALEIQFTIDGVRKHFALRAMQ